MAVTGIPVAAVTTPLRSGGDSNPRDESTPPTRFPIVLLQPLGHHSNAEQHIRHTCSARRLRPKTVGGIRKPAPRRRNAPNYSGRRPRRCCSSTTKPRSTELPASRPWMACSTRRAPPRRVNPAYTIFNRAPSTTRVQLGTDRELGVVAAGMAIWLAGTPGLPGRMPRFRYRSQTPGV